MGKKAIGVDVGGTGIKAAVVDTKTGELTSERLKLGTPDGGEPEDIAQVVKAIVNSLPGSQPKPIGICFPAVVQNGFTQSAANVSDRWIGLDAKRLFSEALGQEVLVMNDADAAGVAEVDFGAGKSGKGLIVMTTLGTGIGTALFYNGRLIPNAELGHIEIDGVDYETMAAYSAMEREGLSFPQWAERLQRYYGQLEKLLSPELFIVGGGISKSSDEFLPLLDLKTPIVPAQLLNAAGIIGVAAAARESV
jgi:polyphosphate glucokinase